MLIKVIYCYTSFFFQIYKLIHLSPNHNITREELDRLEKLFQTILPASFKRNKFWLAIYTIDNNWINYIDSLEMNKKLCILANSHHLMWIGKYFNKISSESCSEHWSSSGKLFAVRLCNVDFFKLLAFQLSLVRP